MINVLHLYYDLMNLYGENANVRCIIEELKNNKIKVNVDYKTIDDEINFDKYDLVYIAQGSEDDLFIAIDDLLKRKDDIKKYIENNKYLLLTGNSMCMFGKHIITNDNKKINTLNIFDYDCKFISQIDNSNASCDRIVYQTYSTFSKIEKTIIGFQNRCDIINNISTPLFKGSDKYSNDLKGIDEGFNYKNVYATHNIGPLLIRNPYFTKYLLSKICKDNKLKFKDVDKSLYIAYKKYLG